MDCVISPKNALVLDKLMKTIKTSDLRIDTTSRILLQMVSDDKTRCCNILLDEAFFVSVKVKKKLCLLNKPKFYIPKMKALRIFNYEDVMLFEYELEGCVFRHRLFGHECSIYTLSFQPHQQAPFDHTVFLEVLKQIKGGGVKVEFREGHALLTNEDNKIKFQCCDLEGVRFDLCLPSFKVILGICKDFNESFLCWEDEGGL